MKYFMMIVAVLIATAGFSQNGGMGEMDKKYTPPVGSMFHTDKKTTAGTAFDNNNILKFDIGLLTRGIVALEYERSVVGLVSVVGGLGLTLFPDYIIYYRNSITEFSDMPTPVTDGPGTYLKGEFRLNQDNIGNGAFMGLGGRLIRHNYIDADYSGSRYTQSSIDAFYAAGIQLPLGSSATVEFTGATGYRFLNAYRRIGNGSFGSPYDLSSYSTSQYFFLLTAKLGFGF